jgi:hypothetical protein
VPGILDGKGHAGPVAAGTNTREGEGEAQSSGRVSPGLVASFWDRNASFALRVEVAECDPAHEVLMGVDGGRGRYRHGEGDGSVTLKHLISCVWRQQDSADLINSGIDELHDRTHTVKECGHGDESVGRRWRVLEGESAVQNGSEAVCEPAPKAWVGPLGGETSLCAVLQGGDIHLVESRIWDAHARWAPTVCAWRRRQGCLVKQRAECPGVPAGLGCSGCLGWSVAVRGYSAAGCCGRPDVVDDRPPSFVEQDAAAMKVAVHDARLSQQGAGAVHDAKDLGEWCTVLNAARD